MKLFSTTITENNLIKKPTIFYVSSPFQILCALEAIYYYQIDQYKFILGTTNDIRDTQMFKLLEQQKIPYELFPLNKLTNIDRLLLIIKSYCKKNHRTYKQAFLGDYFTLDFYIHSFQFLKRGSNIIYLDDGTSTIAIFNRQINANLIFKIKKAIISLNLFLKGIKGFRYYFTLFSDIKTKQFICLENKFSLMKEIKSQNIPTDVYIVGTNINRFCDVFNIQISDFISQLELLFKNLIDKYIAKKIIYIPHGRDTNTNIVNLCKAYKIEYRKLDVAIEYYMFKERIFPEAVYGFTSTALFNLKKMYPKTSVYNIRIKGNNSHYNQLYNTISEYYKKHEIVLYTME